MIKGKNMKTEDTRYKVKNVLVKFDIVAVVLILILSARARIGIRPFQGNIGLSFRIALPLNLPGTLSRPFPLSHCIYL